MSTLNDDYTLIRQMSPATIEDISANENTINLCLRSYKDGFNRIVRVNVTLVRTFVLMLL